MKNPVMHDDQHGTRDISGAACSTHWETVRKDTQKINN